MRLTEEFTSIIRNHNTVGVISDELEKIVDDYAIKFHNWMRNNDIPANAEKYYHYSDEDMLNVFKEEKGL